MDGTDFVQNYESDENGQRTTWGRDTTKKDKEIPIGLFQWVIEPRLGTIVPAENNDTVAAHYSHFNNTDGYNGEYSYLGNIASPRLSRIFLNRRTTQPFLFLNPFDFGIGNVADLRFTNTLSPVTNLSYHSCGNKQTGEDRVRAYFASNINKISGIGFKLDYLYGRGYYNSSQNSIFDGNLFGYYLGERYNMHAYLQMGHQKNAENGGIEDDRYILDPQSFQQSYGSKDIPTMLADAYNRNDYQKYYLTHNYKLGYYKDVVLPDSLQPKMPEDKELLKQLNDSIREVLKADTLRLANVLDSLRTQWTNSIVTPQEFVPVSNIIHTLQIDHLNHTHYSYNTPEDFYTNLYYGGLGYAYDKTKALKIKNTVGLSLNEGFKKWVKMGLTAFVSHKFERIALPYLEGADKAGGLYSYTRNNLSVGGEINKALGSLIHYRAVGDVNLVGTNIGEFDVDGRADLNIPMFKKDTVQIAAHAFIKNVTPDFYFEHYHSQYAWWDNDLNMEKRIRIEGTLSNKRTKTSITVGTENLTNYSYLAMSNTLHTGADPLSTVPADYSHAVQVRQAGGNIQVFSATLKQDFKLGPLTWDNELSYQTTSDADILPLPKFNAYSRLCLTFLYAKVLRIELGGDIRYFSNYYAPDYSTSLGQFAVQDTGNPRVKIGNYPIINAFANLHIKRCRIYVSINHVNAGSGRMFLAPHYPINPMTIHWGVSWNFFN